MVLLALARTMPEKKTAAKQQQLPETMHAGAAHGRPCPTGRRFLRAHFFFVLWEIEIERQLAPAHFKWGFLLAMHIGRIFWGEKRQRGGWCRARRGHSIAFGAREFSTGRFHPWGRAGPA